MARKPIACAAVWCWLLLIACAAEEKKAKSSGAKAPRCDAYYLTDSKKPLKFDEQRRYTETSTLGKLPGSRSDRIEWETLTADGAVLLCQILLEETFEEGRYTAAPGDAEGVCGEPFTSSVDLSSRVQCEPGTTAGDTGEAIREKVSVAAGSFDADRRRMAAGSGTIDLYEFTDRRATVKSLLRDPASELTVTYELQDLGKGLFAKVRSGTQTPAPVGPATQPARTEDCLYDRSPAIMGGWMSFPAKLTDFKSSFAFTPACITFDNLPSLVPTFKIHREGIEIYFPVRSLSKDRKRPKLFSYDSRTAYQFDPSGAVVKIPSDPLDARLTIENPADGGDRVYTETVLARAPSQAEPGDYYLRGEIEELEAQDAGGASWKYRFQFEWQQVKGTRKYSASGVVEAAPPK